MDQDGKRCRSEDTEWRHYHGNPELYDYDGPEPTWVRVALCPRHRQKNKPKKLAPQGEK
jgi:hypothetical protein